VGPFRVEESDNARERAALNDLWGEMALRRILTDDGAEEDVRRMYGSAETLLREHVQPARSQLPENSALDPVLVESLGDALNRFRTKTENWPPNYDYRAALRDLREDVLAVVGAANMILPTARGARLFRKIDPGSAEFGQLRYDSSPDGSDPPQLN
jgi:hypothetical protein